MLTLAEKERLAGIAASHSNAGLLHRCGLKCPYRSWTYDTSGQVMDEQIDIVEGKGAPINVVREPAEKLCLDLPVPWDHRCASESHGIRHPRLPEGS